MYHPRDTCPTAPFWHHGHEAAEDSPLALLTTWRHEVSCKYLYDASQQDGGSKPAASLLSAGKGSGQVSTVAVTIDAFPSKLALPSPSMLEYGLESQPPGDPGSHVTCESIEA